MTIVIERWYNRLLGFIGLELLGLVICYAPAAISASEGFLLWILFPLTGIIGIASACKHFIKRMRTLRFLVVFILVLVSGILFWSVFPWAIFMAFGIDHLGMAMLIMFTAPMMALWTLACLMTLAHWPFSAVRNVETSC